MPNATEYVQHRTRAGERQRALAAAGRDIAPLPPIENPGQRARCKFQLRQFCEIYFPERFYWAWSPDHLKVLRKLERTILRGGLFAIAMPRGSGKTALVEVAAVWALVYGHRAFIVIIGPEETHAAARITNLRSEFENNERLAADFPEVCVPIRRLEGVMQRRLLYNGRPVKMEITSHRIVLPNLPGSPSSAARVETAGITGQIRGLLHAKPSGELMRPDQVILDDPQTDESARSPAQCKTREAILNGAILGLAGPGQRIAAVMPCTVIAPDDLSDRILNCDANPQWQGERTRMVYQFPTNTELWDRYAELRKADQLAGDELAPNATAFFAANREAMDAGSEIAWPQRHEPHELSGLQHAMNLLIDRKRPAFFAEYQNEPIHDDPGQADQLTTADLLARLNGERRGVVPTVADRLTLYIDVHGAALYWMAVAWEADGTGYVVDYGTEPEQRRAYYSLADIRRTLKAAAPHAGLEGQIYAGLERLTARTLGTEQTRADGSQMRVDRCMIDANWGDMTEVVYRFCRQSPHAAILLPSHGRGVGASALPVSQWKRRPGERAGLEWRLRPAAERRGRSILYDANFWKSWIASRLRVAMGDRTALTFWGRDPAAHELLADHLTAEYAVPTEGRGRKTQEWKTRAEGRDNHFLDCLTGNGVCASTLGVMLPAHTHRTVGRKSFKERYAKFRSDR